MPEFPRRGALAALLLIAALAYGYRLGFPDFWGSHWESRRAGIGRTMLETGEWTVPYENGVLALQKPPLYYWMIAGSMAVTGNREELGARLPSAVAAVAALALTWRLAVLLGGGGGGAPLFAVLFLFGNVVYFGHARTAEMDMVLLAVETAAAWAFFEARARARRSPPAPGGAAARPRGPAAFALAGWVLLAAGFMLKGPVGIVVPLALVLAWRLAGRRDPGAPRGWIRPGLGLPLFLVLGLAWYAVVLARIPGSLHTFLHETVARIGEPYDHQEPAWYYLPVLLVGFLPATLFTPLWVREARGSGPSAVLLRRLAVVLAVLVVFFSLSGSKRVYYVLPLWPVLALGFGAAVDAARRRGPRPTRWLTAPLVLLGLVLALAAPAAALVPVLGGPPFFARSAAAYGLLAVIAGLGAWGTVLALRGHRLRSLVAATAALVLANLFVVEGVGPVSNAYRSRAGFAREVAERVPPEVPVFIFRATNLALPFYADRVMPFLRNTEQVADAVRERGEILLVLDPDHERALREAGLRIIPVFTRAWTPPGRPGDVRAMELARVGASG